MKTFSADLLKTTLYARAYKCLKLAGDLLADGCYIIAGSSVASDTIRDIDVYPTDIAEFKIPKTGNVTCVSETKNATTVRTSNGVIVQYCNYRKPTLEALLESFDFAHIQAGAKISSGEVVEVRWTDSYLYSCAAGSSYFTGSEYPSASLVRLLKYYKREEISERHAMGAAFAIVSGIVSR